MRWTNRVIDAFGRVKSYFQRGTGTLGLGIAMVNTLTLWYIAGSELHTFRALFKNNFVYFAVVFLPTYTIAMITFGYWDMKRGFYKAEQVVTMKWNPANQLQMYCLARMPDVWTDLETLEEILPYMTHPKWTAKISYRIDQLRREAA